MRKVLKQIRMGAGYLPGYGDHPGTFTLLLMIGMGAWAGIDHGPLGMVMGAVFMFAFFGPIWCIGCISRANAYDRKHS